MRRIVVLGSLVAVGALSMGLAALQQGGGQQEIGVTQVRDNLYLLSGGGGNTAAFVTSDAVVVVDAKNPGWGQPILDKIRELTPKPVTMLINTHTHGDHVGGGIVVLVNLLLERHSLLLDEHPLAELEGGLSLGGGLHELDDNTVH